MIEEVNDMADLTGTAAATPPVADEAAQERVAVASERTTHAHDRVGAKAIGVEYGNPYDPTAPPYSVYNDPLREALEAREAEAQAEAERKSKARGTEYRFDGHASPYEGTEILKTANGSASIGETLVLSKADADALSASGFVLVKVEKDSK